MVTMFDARTPYLAQLARLVDLDRLKSRRAARRLRRRCTARALATSNALLDGGKTKVTELHGFRNPVFPGMHAPEPIARNLDDMRH